MTTILGTEKQQKNDNFPGPQLKVGNWPPRLKVKFSSLWPCSPRYICWLYFDDNNAYSVRMRCERSYSPRMTDIAISLCMLMPLTGCMQMERVIPECTTSPYSRSRRSVKLVLYRVLVRAGRTYSLIPRSSHLDSRLFDRTAWARRRTTPFTSISDHTLN